MKPLSESDQHLRILVVDDDSAIRTFLRVSLTARNFDVFEAENGQEAIEGVTTHRPDLVLLDLGLPDMDGLQVTRLLRQWSHAPILILSVRGNESDKVAALDAGADDYITKPFGVNELLARMRATLRRATQEVSGPVLVTGDLSVNLINHAVMLGGRYIQLTRTEYDLLRILIIHLGKVLTHKQLMLEVWGNTEVEAPVHNLRVYISSLRRKLEPDPNRPHYVITEPGVGYRLRDETGY
jgi:two-component system KDP operon response regulator KdpE